MIELTRDRDKVHRAFTKTERIDNALELLTFDSDNKRVVKSTYWKKAKPQLKQETFGKCAYCEESASTVAHCDVEHYRPKSKYWWLAYCYDNYLFSCQLCNQSFKKSFFPLIDDNDVLTEPPNVPAASAAITTRKKYVKKMSPDPVLKKSNGSVHATNKAAFDKFVTACVGEGALLVNPYFEKPDKFFIWENNDQDKTVDIIPKPGNSAASTKLNEDRCQAAIDFYGLNRDDLRLSRWQEFRKLRAFKNVIQSGAFDPDVVDETKDVVRMMIESSAPFAGMSRYYVNEVWNVDLS